MKETALLMACLEAFGKMTETLVQAMREEGKEQRKFMLELVDAGKNSALEGATKAGQVSQATMGQAIVITADNHVKR